MEQDKTVGFYSVTVVMDSAPLVVMEEMEATLDSLAVTEGMEGTEE